MKKIRLLYFLYLFVLTLPAVYAGDSLPNIYTEQQKKDFALPDSIKEKAIFNKAEYQYKAIKKIDNKKESFWQRMVRYITNFFNNLNPPKTSSDGPINIFKWMLLLLGIGLAIFLLYKSPFIAILRGNKKLKNVNFEADEIKLSEETIDQMIEKAEANADYKKAIRLQLLKLLKYLSDTHQIEWESHKTNQDFIYEIKNSNVKQNYTSIAKAYDLVWYGERVISNNDYSEIKKIVQSHSYNVVNG
jgi:hypothetical protein